MTKIAIIGAGGFGREVLDLLEACNAAGAEYDILGFIVDREYGEPGTIVNDKPILGDFDWLASHAQEVELLCAIGAPEMRRAAVIRAQQMGCSFATVVHPRALLTRWVELGEGTIVTAGCILTNQIRIGAHVHIDSASTIAHDSTLSDFVRLSPGVHVSGNVRLSEGAYIGTGANIIEKVLIGAWSIVGAGSTVIGDIPANVTAVGSPAKVIKEREPGWHLQPR